MPKYKKSLLLFSVLLFMMYLFSTFIAKPEIHPCTSKKYFLESTYSGRVKQKYIYQAKKSFRKDTIIVLENGTPITANLSFIKLLYQNLQINDSLVKDNHTDILNHFRAQKLIHTYQGKFNCP